MRIWGMARCDMCGTMEDGVEHVRIAADKTGYSASVVFLEADLCADCMLKANETVDSVINRLAHELGGEGKTR